MFKLLHVYEHVMCEINYDDDDDDDELDYILRNKKKQLGDVSFQLKF